MNQIARRLHLFWRIEPAIAEARLHILIRRSILFAMAGFVAVLGLCMLNGAGFFALESLWGPAKAAVIIALSDLALATVLGSVALAATRSPILKRAVALRQSAIEDIENDFSGLRTRMARRGLSANEIACALIPMMARSTTRSNQRPDTSMQDRLPPVRRNPLATHGRTIHRVRNNALNACQRRPLRLTHPLSASRLLTSSYSMKRYLSDYAANGGSSNAAFEVARYLVRGRQQRRPSTLSDERTFAMTWLPSEAIPLARAQVFVNRAFGIRNYAY
jgi:hypothetical protein